MATIQPLKDYLLLEPVKEEVSEGGIILTTVSETAKVARGRLIASGPDVPGFTGDAVFIYSIYGATEVETPTHKKFVLVPWKEVLALVK